MSNSTKFRFMIALSTVMGYATAASATPASVATVNGAAIVDSHCVPGMTAKTPGRCSLPGFHWAYTTESMGHNNFYRAVWMLLPNG